MVTTMAFLQYYLKSSTKRGWEMSSLLVAIHSMNLSVTTKHRGEKTEQWNRLIEFLITLY